MQSFYAHQHLAGVRAAVLTTVSLAQLSSSFCFPRESLWLLFRVVPCRWSVPTVPSSHPGTAVRSVFVHCCWGFLITKNHRIWTVSMPPPVQYHASTLVSHVALLTFILERSAWSWSQCGLDRITSCACLYSQCMRITHSAHLSASRQADGCLLQ